MPDHDLHHDPVLLKEVLEYLLTDQTTHFFDGTLGLGGHAEKVISCPSGLQVYIGCDLDAQHLEYADQRLKALKAEKIKIQLHQMNFSDIQNVVPDNRSGSLSILLDLGLCSNHVDDASKGFSFSEDGPLNMSFSSNPLENAETVLNHYEQRDLTRIFREYGEEPAAFRIARAINDKRKQQPLRTTFELKEVISSQVSGQALKKALTRIFQAIRMEVNEELHHLEHALADCLELMDTGDRLGVISYHSLEDRVVKKFFAKSSKPETREGLHSLHEEVAPAKGALLTRKPIGPSDTELQKNPRSRSAKLRVIEKK